MTLVETAKMKAYREDLEKEEERLKSLEENIDAQQRLLKLSSGQTHKSIKTKLTTLKKERIESQTQKRSLRDLLQKGEKAPPRGELPLAEHPETQEAPFSAGDQEPIIKFSDFPDATQPSGMPLKD